MRKIPFAEWFISQDIGAERGAAIMGDLEELAQTRGRLWFWAEYLRTLIALGWRTAGSAFILAMVCLKLMFGNVVPWLMEHRTPGLMDAGLFGVTTRGTRTLYWNLSLVAAQFLCFAMPFVLVRYGLRDRLSRLACALFLVALPVFSFRPWFMDLADGLMILIFAAALISAPWRRPLAILLATLLIAAAVKLPYFVLQFFLSPKVYSRHLYRFPGAWAPFVEAVSFAIAATVCVRLHRWLMEPPSPPAPPLVRRRPTCVASHP